MERDREFSIEELGEIAELSSDHPRRREFERSPRGRALLATYRSFVNPGAAGAEAGLEQARAHLQALLVRELGQSAGPAAAGAAGERRPPSNSWSWRSWAALRPVLALAVMVIVAAGAWVATQHRGASNPVLRGRRVGGTVELALHAPRATAEGLELSWEPVAGADRYEVAFFASDLGDLAHAPATSEPRLVLSLATLPSGLTRGSTVLWQVSARRGDTPLAQSETSPLQIP